MWRDPLDELIDDLEGALPVVKLQDDSPPLFDIQRAVQAVLAGGETLERAKREPWYQEVVAKMTRQVERHRQK